MSRTARVLAVSAAAGLAVPLWAAPASAATLAETASVGAYYLATNPGNVEGPLGGQRAPDNAKSVDGVAEDDLAVSVAAPGQVDKKSALLWDLVDLAPGATVEKASVVLPLSTQQGSTQRNANPVFVKACLAGPEGFGDADGEPFSDAPTDACADGEVVGAPAEGGKAVEFDITAIAQKWTEANSGLLLIPAQTTQPFQVVFADKSQARLTVAFTGGLEEVVVDDPELSATSDGGTSALDLGAGGGFDAGSGGAFDSTGSSGGVPFDAGSTETPALAGAADAAQAPTVADPATAAPRLVPAASSFNPMAFDALTWASLIGGAGLLAAVSLALGAPVQAAGSTAPAVRPGGVASALSRRTTRLG